MEFFYFSVKRFSSSVDQDDDLVVVQLDRSALNGQYARGFVNAFEPVLIRFIEAQLTLDPDVSFLEERNDRRMVVQHLKLTIHSGNRD